MCDPYTPRPPKRQGAWLPERTISTSLATILVPTARELWKSSVGEAPHGEVPVGGPQPVLCEAHNSTVDGESRADGQRESCNRRPRKQVSDPEPLTVADVR